MVCSIGISSRNNNKQVCTAIIMNEIAGFILGNIGSEMSVDLTAADIKAAGPDGGAGAGESNMQNAGNSSMRPSNNGTGGGDRNNAQRDAGNMGTGPSSSSRMATGNGGGNANNDDGGNSKMDENGDMQNSGQRRSIISSIRLV
jgi:hypothetical protein